MGTILPPPRRNSRIVAALPLVIVLALGVVYATQSPTMSVKLIDQLRKAKQQTATVQVTVGGIKLVDPDTTPPAAQAGEGHLHYQVDGGPLIATTTTKLSFHGLGAGTHSVIVTLVGNDHSPLGPQETIAVVIP